MLVERTDRKYGVRDLERVIKAQIADPLTDAVLDYGTSQPITMIDVSVHDGRITVEVA